MQALRNKLEAFNVPADWISPSSTWRELLRRTAGIFQFSQRYFGMWGEPLFPVGATYDLDTRFVDLPANIQTQMIGTAQNLGYPIDQFVPANRLRQMLRVMAEAWGAAPFEMCGIVF